MTKSAPSGRVWSCFSFKPGCRSYFARWPNQTHTRLSLRLWQHVLWLTPHNQGRRYETPRIMGGLAITRGKYNTVSQRTTACLAPMLSSYVMRAHTHTGMSTRTKGSAWSPSACSEAVGATEYTNDPLCIDITSLSSIHTPVRSSVTE